MDSIYKSLISDNIYSGISAKEELLEIWKEELSSLEENEINKEKKVKLEKYINQAEKCLLLSRKANKLMNDLDELGELERGM